MLHKEKIITIQKFIIWSKKTINKSPRNVIIESVKHCNLYWKGTILWFQRLKSELIICIQIWSSNLFVTSKNEFSNTPILHFTSLKCCIKAKEPLKSPFWWCISSYLLLYLSLIFYFKYILQHFKFVNWRIAEYVFWCHEQVISSSA